MREFVTIFLALLFETTPFLLAGVVIAVAGGPLIERALSTAAMRRPIAGLAAGASAGMLLPMCDCGSRPLAHRLALAGRREFAVAFLVAAPVVNPIVVVTTWLAFREAEIVALRLGITVVMALLAGLILGMMRREIALPSVDAHEHGGGLAALPGRVLGEFFELFPFLVVGSAMAAGLQVFVDQSLLTESQGLFLTIGAMMLLAFLLSICSSVDAFVVAGLGGSLGTGPVLAFLVFGPLVNLKSVPMYLRLFTVPAVVVLGVLVTQVAFVSAVGVQLRGW